MQILHSKVLGEGNNRVLIILHGLFGMLDNWNTLARKYAEYFEVHLLDLRNHGRSFHSSEFNYSVMADDVLNYIDAKALDKVNLIGHSMGGKVSMKLATSFGYILDKVVIADISPKFYPVHHQQILNALSAINFEEATSRSDVEEQLRANLTAEEGVYLFLMKSVYRKEDGKYDLRFNLKDISLNIEEVGKALEPYEKFDGPTLFIGGSKSHYIQKEDHILIKQNFENASIKSIEGAGHWLHAEKPNEFYQLSRTFLG